MNDDYKDSPNAWSDETAYMKMYTALKDLEQYNVSISVPEFVFIGFQSSGKTSAVSQAAKMCVGTMKSGTASRCPTRFKLVNKPGQKKPLITVNNELCANESAMTERTLALTEVYEQQDVFSSDIIEVRIECETVPELTFVDLPGLIKGSSEKFAKARKQLDVLTRDFLLKKNPDGNWRYVPILVREPVDVEHDTKHEVKYINKLVGRQRPDWMDNALFIVNKFDRQITRAPAKSLIDYLEYLCDNRPDLTIITMCNANGQNCANMTQKELNAFVMDAKNVEEEKWNSILSGFKKANDPDYSDLIGLKDRICGIPHMNEVLSTKMCDIVKRMLPGVEKELNRAEHGKQLELSAVKKQIDNCNPVKLKNQCVEFNSRFLLHLKHFYAGQLGLTVGESCYKTWREEMDDFQAWREQENVADWDYEVPPDQLADLLRSSTEKLPESLKSNVFKNDGKPRELLSLIEMKLTASASINRGLDAWIAQVAYMPFPMYTDQEIVNMCGTFSHTKQPDLWAAVRNVVLNAVSFLSDAEVYLCEMFRFKLKQNAEAIFEFTKLKELQHVKTDQIDHFLNRSLEDYESEIDRIMDEFTQAIVNVPQNHAQILDKSFCEETIAVGKLLDDLLDCKNVRNFAVSKEEQQRKKGHRVDSEYERKSSPPPSLGRPRSHSDGELELLMQQQGDRSPSPSPSVSAQSVSGKSKRKNKKSGHKKRFSLSGYRSKKKNKSKGKSKKQDFSKHSKSKKQSPQPKLPSLDESVVEESLSYSQSDSDSESKDRSDRESVYADEFDCSFYQRVYGAPLVHQLVIGSAGYDIPLIRHLAHSFWTNIKFFTIRDVVQKLSNRVMSHVNRNSDRLANAVLCGVHSRQVQALMDRLVAKTGVDISILEDLIQKEKKIEIRKAINEMTPQEISAHYGMDRDQLLKEKEVKQLELDNFRKAKQVTLEKIENIKRGKLQYLD